MNENETLVDPQFDKELEEAFGKHVIPPQPEQQRVWLLTIVGEDGVLIERIFVSQEVALDALDDWMTDEPITPDDAALILDRLAADHRYYSEEYGWVFHLVEHHVVDENQRHPLQKDPYDWRAARAARDKEVQP
jgi:hypothetical protein